MRLIIGKDMIQHRRGGVAAGATVGLLVLLGALSSAFFLAGLDPQGGPPEGIHLEVPPPELHDASAHSFLRLGSTFDATVDLSTEERMATIRWRYSSTGNFASPEAGAHQELALSYWPTAAEVMDGNRVLVAGKETRGGDTTIELWTLQAPLVSQPGGGGPTVITPRPLLAVDAVYNDAVVGKDMVRVMFHVRGAQPPAALVQFHDSRSLYRCSLVAPYTWTLLYDSQTEPGLASDFNVYVSGDHAAHGYAYILGQEYGVANQAWPLVLLDSDRDGAIDDHFVLDFDAYHFAQFDDRESWLEYKRLTD